MTKRTNGGARVLAVLLAVLLAGLVMLSARLWPYWVAGSRGAGANLRGLTLVYAPLQGANLRGADLTGTNLRRADLRGTDLRGATLVGTVLTGARYDAYTCWPQGLNPKQRGAVRVK